MVKPTLFLAVILLLGIPGISAGQTPLNPAELVKQAEAAGGAFKVFPLLGAVKKEKEKRGTQQFVLRLEVLQRLYEAAPEHMIFMLPEGGEARLVRVEILAGDFEGYTSNGGSLEEIKKSLHYRGVLADVPGSIIALSVFPSELMGLVSVPGLGEWSIEPAPGDPAAVVWAPRPAEPVQKIQAAVVPQRGDASQRSIRLYLELNHDVVLSQGGNHAAAAFAVACFHQMAALYAGQGIRVELSGLFLWDTESPYTGDNSSLLLSQFQAVRTAFNGDLAQLLSVKGGEGMAVAGGLCREAAALRMSVAGMGGGVPAQVGVAVMGHQLAHQLGGFYHEEDPENHALMAVERELMAEDGFAGLPEFQFSLRGFVPPAELRQIRERIVKAGCLEGNPAGMPEQGEEELLPPSLALELFPNPATTHLTLRFSGAAEASAQISVYNSAGQLVLHRVSELVSGENTVTLAVAQMAPGAYFVRVEGEGIRVEAGFVIQR